LQQKARDNRAYLKATRRDLEHLNDQELFSTELSDDESKPVVCAAQAGKDSTLQGTGQQEAMLGKFSISGAAQVPSCGMSKPVVCGASPASLTEQGNFMKPRPLSRCVCDLHQM